MLRSIPRPLRASTPDLPAVPIWLQAWLLLFLGPILAWAETRIYRAVLAQCRDHPLVQIGRFYDPAAVVAACAGFRVDPARLASVGFFAGSHPDAEKYPRARSAARGIRMRNFSLQTSKLYP